MSFQLPPQTEFHEYIERDPAYWERVLDEGNIGQSMADMSTPALVIDRAVFARNCAEIRKRAELWNWRFRADIGSHKVRASMPGTRS